MQTTAVIDVRRTTLTCCITAVVIIMLSCNVMAAGTSAGERANDRPNILFAIADDWSWPHAGVYGDKVIKTPVFDRIASRGVLFTHAFCAAPTCTPSRGAILTGQAIHRLEEGGNLFSTLQNKFRVYPDILEASGYYVGYTGKGWSPGNYQLGGWSRNPAGPKFKGGFREFLEKVPLGRPFCFWFGSHDPHRAYEKGSGLKSGMKIEDVVVPPFLPDTPEVRSDMLDYYFEVQRFDSQVGRMLELLEARNLLDNTMVVMTSDNGMPFPRAKANLYDCGSRMPMAVRWPVKIKGGRRVDDFISFTDFAPTFLEAADLKPLREMTGCSFLDLLIDSRSTVLRDKVFLERERHAYCRKDNLSYPSRAIRTKQYLYIRNFLPDRWPQGEPHLNMILRRNGRKKILKLDRQFGDVDDSPSKNALLAGRNDPQISALYKLAFAKRPAEELYDLDQDPHQLINVADRPKYAEVRQKLRGQLDHWLKETADPRVLGLDNCWDSSPYVGGWKEISN
ncbi:MAG: sulfatase [Planctomycetota bacterium]|nr:MAG: sulfatase [Planctomycetota bacterium]